MVHCTLYQNAYEVLNISILYFLGKKKEFCNDLQVITQCDRKL